QVERLNAAEDVADQLSREKKLDPKDRAKKIAELVGLHYAEAADRRAAMEQLEKRLQEQVSELDKKIDKVGRRLRSKKLDKKERPALEQELRTLRVQRDAVLEALADARRGVAAATETEASRYAVGREELRARSYYAPDYALAAAILNRSQRSWAGLGTFPYAKWGYFLSRTIYHHLVEPILDESRPTKERIAALAAFIELVAPFYYWGLKSEEESEAPIVTTEKARAGMTYSIDRSGRSNLSLLPVIGPAAHRALGLDPRQHELHMRTIKYPLADVGIAAAALRAGDLESFTQAASEKISPGPLLQTAAALAGYRNKYN